MEVNQLTLRNTVAEYVKQAKKEGHHSTQELYALQQDLYDFILFLISESAK